MNNLKFVDINNLEIGTCDRCKKETEDAGEVAYGVYLCYDCCDDYNDYKFNITSKGEIEEELTMEEIKKIEFKILPKPEPLPTNNIQGAS
jgi:hypothetical protein